MPAQAFPGLKYDQSHIPEATEPDELPPRNWLQSDLASDVAPIGALQLFWVPAKPGYRERQSECS